MSRRTSGPNNEYELLAYRDNGTSADLLWRKNFGTDTVKTFIFGPGETLYTVGKKIYAASEGEIGDPDGGGMAFTDNNQPTSPDNPSPADSQTEQTINLTLSWTSSDPDGHDLKYDIMLGALVEGGEGAFGPVATQLTTPSYNLTGLTPGTRYFWKVIATDGQSVAESPTWSFVTINEPPSIISNTPASGAINVAINTAITATFSESLDPTTVNANTVTLLHSSGTTSGTVTYDPSTKIVTFIPDNNLAFNTQYGASFDGIKDLLGASMSLSGWLFTTSDQADTNPPSVISNFPSHNAANQEVTIQIKATFNENMEVASINTLSFLVNDGTRNNIAGTVSYAGFTATFTPAYDLSYSTTYTVTITTTVKDLSGNNMATNYSWAFTTGSDPGAVSIPNPPSNLSASDGLYEDRVEITFAPSPGATSYEIYRSTSPTSYGVLIGTTALNIYNDHNGSTDKYLYFVRARNSAGVSAFSGPNEGYSKAVQTDNGGGGGGCFISSSSNKTSN